MFLKVGVIVSLCISGILLKKDQKITIAEIGENENCDLCELDTHRDVIVTFQCHQYLSPNKTKTFTTIDELFSCLPNFTQRILQIRVNISGFNFGVVPNGSFSRVPYMAKLTLRECNITRLEPNAFNGSEIIKLAIVDVGKDKEGISILNRRLLQQFHTIAELNLGKVRSIENETFTALPDLYRLTLEHKSILDHNQVFRHMHKLRILILDGIGLKQIPGVILPYIPTLQELNLANNAITSLRFNGTLGTRWNFRLDVSGNSIKSVTQSDMIQFKDVGTLSLDLGGNDLEEIERYFLRDINTIDKLLFNRNLKLGKTNAFMNLLKSSKGKPIKRLGLSGCGIVIDSFNSSILKPLEDSDLQTLWLGNNLIDTLESDAFEPVKSLYYLEISNFMHISNETFSPLRNLGSLEIHDMSVLQTRKEHVNVRLNQLRELDTLWLHKLDYSRIFFTFGNDQPNLRNLTLNNLAQPFTNWLRRRKHQKGKVYHDKLCSSSEGPTNQELLKFELTWLECNMEVFIRIIALSVSSVVLVGIITASLLKYFWQDIKYMQLVRRAKRHHGYIRIPVDDPNAIQDDIPMDGGNPEDEIYDAFVSYHSEKRIWVRDVMTPELTKGEVPFSLIHDDNIIPGQESYFGGLMSHMDRSRHIIFLVTRGWMKEGWNEFEMDSAIDMLTQTKRHTLIVILLEHIPQKEMSHKLKLMVRHNVCLKWSEEEGKQRTFWRDLKLELGKKRYE
ncbi:unnamed protein product [Owenia fusiformis]|uniref:Uncharacterized protein n=1 Tax=Owenia fusiformis TaxID=6347 RepID=A0A8J1UWI4_OWEFU|nr:unnamed protein product [Owenia fusiformis]